MILCLLYFSFFVQQCTEKWFSYRIVYCINIFMRFYFIMIENFLQIVVILLYNFVNDLFVVFYLFCVTIYYIEHLEIKIRFNSRKL